jgi:general secretion pathway protein G
MNHTAHRMDSQASARRDHGFTLIEIMVVVVIIGLLATLVGPQVFSMSEQAKEGKAQSDVKAIYDAADFYRTKNSKIPTIEELQAVDERGRSYLDERFDCVDPWGNPYEIRETDRGRFEVISWGLDKTSGTEDDISSTRRKDK